MYKLPCLLKCVSLCVLIKFREKSNCLDYYPMNPLCVIICYSLVVVNSENPSTSFGAALDRSESELSEHLRRSMVDGIAPLLQQIQVELDSLDHYDCIYNVNDGNLAYISPSNSTNLDGMRLNNWVRLNCITEMISIFKTEYRKLLLDTIRESTDEERISWHGKYKRLTKMKKLIDSILFV